jgi:hypothetical protein
VVLGEIDYLLGDHGRAHAELSEAIRHLTALGDGMGRAQGLILLTLVEEASGAANRGRELVKLARTEFDGLGYRLGIAQCDVALGHADHRAFDFDGARAKALGARASFRELQNPRGEAACERLLAMVEFDRDDFDAAEAHARVALKLYERLQDPWGDLESRLLLSQVALGRRDPRAESFVVACDRVMIDEAEPRQHRHLTRAWLAGSQGQWTEAAIEIDAARDTFAVASSVGGAAAAADARTRTGDHTPHLLRRFHHLEWVGPALAKIASWLQDIETSTRNST